MISTVIKRVILPFFIQLCLFPLLANPASGANIYRCQNGKQISFQEIPCDDSSQQRKFDNASFSSTVTEIVLKKDRNSQFHINGTVNGVTVNFLVDTGANITAIPNEIAEKARLSIESDIISRTATGLSHDFKTTIKELNLGDLFKLNNVAAAIIKGDQALLGMNALDHFEIIENGDTMTIKQQK